MLNGVRLRLTALYLLAALLLVGLMGMGAYQLLDYYFRSTTDLALQHKMAHELTLLGAPVPPELIAADRAWYANRNRLLPRAAHVQPTPIRSSQHSDDDERAGDDVWPRGHGDGERPAEIEAEEQFDGELAAIFVLSLDAYGQATDTAVSSPLSPDSQAAGRAMTQGHDWRTVLAGNGARIRLLTYRVNLSGGPALLQMGRSLTDQDRILGQLLVGLLGVGGVSMLFLGAGSWWLAGRSLRPAQQAWDRQQAFVANASHELRAPLTLMRASTEVALRTAADADQRALLRDVLDECDHMASLVEDLLTLSRMDTGQVTVSRESIVLAELLADVQRQAGRVAAARGVAIQLGSTDGAATGDRARLRQVLLILLDNAIRHTPAGGNIRLDASSQGAAIAIRVADTGNGIPPEHLPHVFERFYRVNSTRGTPSRGAGLGLAIARALMQAQMGTISIESQLSRGTTVTLTLPNSRSDDSQSSYLTQP